jgi:hypothetical protein
MRNEASIHLQCKSAIIRLGPQVSDSVSTLAHAHAPLPCSTSCQEAAAKPDDSRLLLDCALALHRLAAGGAFPQGHWVLSPWLCGARQLCLRWHAFCGRLRRCPAVAPGILCQAPARIFHGWLFIWRDWIWICLILRPQICYPLPLP